MTSRKSAYDLTNSKTAVVEAQKLNAKPKGAWPQRKKTLSEFYTEASLRSKVGNFVKQLLEADSSSEETAEDLFSEPEGKQSDTQDVDVEKVSSTGSESSESEPEAQKTEPEEATLGTCVDKLNTIRSGRSLKDNDILAEMTRYFNDLSDAERAALQAFLTGIAQIVTGGSAGDVAQEPKDPPEEIHMHKKSDHEKTKKVEPVVTKKNKPAPPPESSADRENTAPPTPVAAKKR